MPNNNLAAARYEKQYRDMLATVFGVNAAFINALSPIQIMDGVQENTTAFSVKTNGTPVVVGEYSTDANDGGFGTGAGKSRFGELKEIKYTNTDVPYDYTLAIHEGIDRYTVNNNIEAAVADRLKLNAEAQTRGMNKRIGKFLSTAAGKTEALTDMQEATVRTLVNKIKAYYSNNEVIAPVTLYLRTELVNAIVDMTANTSAKGSSVSIDENGLAKYKGFALVETPEQYFESGDVAYFVPDGTIIPFVGISTARTVEAEDFDGVKL